MSSSEHETEPRTTPPDIPESEAGVPSHAYAGTVSHARGRLVATIRAAERERIRRFEQLQEEIAGLDQELGDRITAAWRQYDAEVTALEGK